MLGNFSELVSVNIAEWEFRSKIFFQMVGVKGQERRGETSSPGEGIGGGEQGGRNQSLSDTGSRDLSLGSRVRQKVRWELVNGVRGMVLRNSMILRALSCTCLLCACHMPVACL